MIAESARDVPAWSSRSASPTSSIVRALVEASIRSPEERDRSRHHSAHRGGPRLSTGTRTYGACRSTPCCLAVWSIWVESSTALGGFRVLKNTLEAPYTMTNRLTGGPPVTAPCSVRAPCSRPRDNRRTLSLCVGEFWLQFGSCFIY